MNRWFRNPRPSLSAKRTPHVRLAVESLEDRTLLSAAQYVPNEILVQFQPGAAAALRASARAVANGVLAETIHTNAMVSAGNGVLERITLPGNMPVEAAIKMFQSNPNVLYAEPNWIYTKQTVSNDPYYTNGSLWGMYSSDTPTLVGPNTPTGITTNQFGSQAEQAWNNGYTGSSTVYIGIIDEGIDFNHPDLAANIWTNPYDPVGGGDDAVINGVNYGGNGYIDDIHGWDFVNNDNSIYDGNSDDHGTHVAGTIGALGNNKDASNNHIGVVGVNWNVTLISAKFLGPNGGTLANAVLALDYLTDLKTRYGLNIVATNNSWGGGGYSQALLDAITRSAKKDILFIAAAGNGNPGGKAINSDSSPVYPASYDTTVGAGYDAVISVAAIDKSGAKASWSNYGATSVDLGAPGVGIWSTLPGNTYGSYSGTSMATPHVTGAAALYASAHLNQDGKVGVTALQIKDAILKSTTPTTSLDGRTATGGRLDIDAVMKFVPIAPLPTLSISSVSISEGSDGNQTAFIFTVTLSAKSATAVKVNYATSNGTATAGSDYTAISGTLTIAAGDLSQTITVLVNGDTKFEPNEDFFVNLTSPSGATIAIGQGVGTIVNDDSQPAAQDTDMYVSSMTWSTVKRGKFTDLLITIAVKNDDGNGIAEDGDANVSGADVTFELSGSGPAGTRYAIGTASTSSAGLITFRFQNVLDTEVYTGTVLNVTHPSALTWNEFFVGQVKSGTYKIVNGSPVPASHGLTGLEVSAPATANLNQTAVIASPPSAPTTNPPAKDKSSIATSGLSLLTSKAKNADDFWGIAALDDAELLQAI